MQAGGIKASHDLGVESVNLPVARQADEYDRTLLSRLKPDGGTRGDVEPEPPRAFPIEAQSLVHLVKVKMGTDLDGPVAGVADRERDRLTARVKFDVAVFGQDFTRDHAALQGFKGLGGGR